MSQIRKKKLSKKDLLGCWCDQHSISMDGFLLKQGADAFHKFRLRWFVVKGPYLFYAETPDDLMLWVSGSGSGGSEAGEGGNAEKLSFHPKGAIDLRGIVARCSLESGSKTSNYDDTESHMNIRTLSQANTSYKPDDPRFTFTLANIGEDSGSIVEGQAKNSDFLLSARSVKEKNMWIDAINRKHRISPRDTPSPSPVHIVLMEARGFTASQSMNTIGHAMTSSANTRPKTVCFVEIRCQGHVFISSDAVVNPGLNGSGQCEFSFSDHFCLDLTIETAPIHVTLWMRGKNSGSSGGSSSKNKPKGKVVFLGTTILDTQRQLRVAKEKAMKERDRDRGYWVDLEGRQLSETMNICGQVYLTTWIEEEKNESSPTPDVAMDAESVSTKRRRARSRQAGHWASEASTVQSIVSMKDGAEVKLESVENEAQDEDDNRQSTLETTLKREGLWSEGEEQGVFSTSTSGAALGVPTALSTRCQSVQTDIVITRFATQHVHVRTQTEETPPTTALTTPTPNNSNSKLSHHVNDHPHGWESVMKASMNMADALEELAVESERQEYRAKIRSMEEEIQQLKKALEVQVQQAVQGQAVVSGGGEGDGEEDTEEWFDFECDVESVESGEANMAISKRIDGIYTQIASIRSDVEDQIADTDATLRSWQHAVRGVGEVTMILFVFIVVLYLLSR